MHVQCVFPWDSYDVTSWLYLHAHSQISTRRVEHYLTILHNCFPTFQWFHTEVQNCNTMKQL